jgi:hypothetical protein
MVSEDARLLGVMEVTKTQSGELDSTKMEPGERSIHRTIESWRRESERCGSPDYLEAKLVDQDL